MHMPNALARASAASNAKQIDEVFRDLAAAVGGCAWVYADLARLLDEPGEYGAACRTTIPDAFRDAYFENQCFFVDPCIPRARSSAGAFLWSHLAEWHLGHTRGRIELSNGASVMRLAFDHGFSNGLVIPLHGTTGDGRPSCALLSVYLDESHDQRLDPHVRAWLPVVAQAAHIRLGEITPEQLQTDRPAAGLSVRERDILSWAAQGCTAEDTAVGLAISARTVEKHLEVAMRKLGAAHKAHAVALAISRGLISL